MSTRAYRDNFRQVTLQTIKKLFNEEVWAFHPNYENIEVSSEGKVRNCNTNHLYSIRKNQDGYSNVSIIPTGHGRSKSCLVHRLVAETFYAFVNPKEFEVNHMNGNKTDNTIYNLEWVTREENMQHARDTGLFVQQNGQANGRYKYSNQDIEDIQKFLELGFTYKEISKAFGLSGTGVFKVLKRRTGCPKYN